MTSSGINSVRHSIGHMGHCICVFFMPDRSYASEVDVFRHCKTHLDWLCPSFEGEFVSFPSAGMLCISSVCGSYLELYMQGTVGSLIVSPEDQQTVKLVCESFGADDWWICDEISVDDMQDLSVGEFENMLLGRSVEMDELIKEDSSWPQGCRFVHDGKK